MIDPTPTSLTKLRRACGEFLHFGAWIIAVTIAAPDFSYRDPPFYFT
jgi:hypothetical protein